MPGLVRGGPVLSGHAIGERGERASPTWKPTRHKQQHPWVLGASLTVISCQLSLISSSEVIMFYKVVSNILQEVPASSLFHFFSLV